MSIWPLWRMGRRGKKRPSQAGEGAVAGKRGAQGVNTMSGANATGVQRRVSRRNSQRPRRRASTKDSSNFEKRLVEKKGSDLSRMDTAGTSDSEKFAPRRRRSNDMTALPAVKELGTSPHLRAVTKDYDIPYDFRLEKDPARLDIPSTSKVQRAPSNKRSASDPLKRRSSKKRKDDRVREEEIRAMSAPRNIERPTSRSGDILRRDSKKMRSGLNRHFERPTSNVSLPLAESIHSSMSSDSGSREFIVGSFDMFMARPTIRMSLPNTTGGGLESSKWNPSRDSSRQQARITPTDEILSASRTIDDLANNMDASALRDLMERDRRRSERKRKLLEERLQAKLERRAERERLRELREKELAEGVASGSVPDPNSVGNPLGIETGPSLNSEQIAVPGTTEELGTDNTGTYLNYPAKGQIPSNPFESPQNEVLTPFLEEPTPMASPLETPFEDPVVEVAQAVRYSNPSMSPPTLSPPASPIDASHPRNPSKLSQLMDVSQTHIPEPTNPLERHTSLQPTISLQTDRRPSASITTSERRPSDTTASPRRKGSSWTAFFRRGTQAARRSSSVQRTTPSEVSFSNTSRESMARQPLPAHLINQPVTRKSGAPVRTQSKFREDLPELPLSPPDSRVHSPEVSAARAIAARKGYQPQINTDSGRSSASPAFDLPSARSDSPSSPLRPGSSALMSTSLASVDSEASWLSGKPSKRGSRRAPAHDSTGSATTGGHPTNDFSASYEELDIPEDEYFQRLTPRAADKRASATTDDTFTRKASSTAIGRDYALGEGDVPALPEGAIIHNSMERQPTVIYRDTSRMKSSEGLLNEFTEAGDRTSSYTQQESTGEDKATPSDEAGTESELPSLPKSSEQDYSYQRARSVDLGRGHVRHLSAGSAKLLDIVPSRRTSRRGSEQPSHREASPSPGPSKLLHEASSAQTPDATDDDRKPEARPQVERFITAMEEL